MVYLTQRRNVERERRTTSVTVYSNVGMPRVTLNGRELPTPRRGYTDVHYVIDSVKLDSGANVIKATVKDKDGREHTDEITWRYNGEQNRAPERYENRNTHAGF